MSSEEEADSDCLIDVADRYQDTVDRQIDSLINFDRKAWRATRLIGILLSVTLSGYSIFWDDLGIEMSVQHAPFLLSFSIGVIGFLAALSFSILSYLSSSVGLGPNTKIGRKLSDGSLDAADYRKKLVRNYTNTIDANASVLESKSRRLKRTSSSIFIAFCFTTVATILAIINLPSQIAWGGLVLSSIAVIAVVYYIHSDFYKTSIDA